MISTNIAQTTEQLQAFSLYCHGEFDGATGGQPIPEFWLNSLDYRRGFQQGQAEYFDKKFSSLNKVV